jgi:dTDP-3-amino-3,4,6-trideoxy-alpha-D-glucose transaminase
VKLPLLAGWNARRAAVAERYLAALAEVPGVALPPPSDGTFTTSWHLFVVRVADRDSVAARLREAGVETLVHYPTPPHRQAAYTPRGPWPDLPIADALARTVLSLPMGPHLPPQDADAVARSLVLAVHP